MNTDDWRDVPAGGTSLRIPASWTELPGEPGRVLLTALAPERDGFSPSLVLTSEQVADDDLGPWSQASVAALREVLHSYHLLDVGADVVDGHPAVLRLATYAIDANPLTSLQWAWLDSGTGSTLTATCRTTDFGNLAAVFAHVAHSLTSEVDR